MKYIRARLIFATGGLLLAYVSIFILISEIGRANDATWIVAAVLLLKGLCWFGIVAGVLCLAFAIFAENKYYEDELPSKDNEFTGA